MKRLLLKVIFFLFYNKRSQHFSKIHEDMLVAVSDHEPVPILDIITRESRSTFSDLQDAQLVVYQSARKGRESFRVSVWGNVFLRNRSRK